MSTPYEEISDSFVNQEGRPDSNLANDSKKLGGVSAEDYATKLYVRNYHDTKEQTLKQYIDSQDANVLNTAKEYTNAAIRNQDFSNFAKLPDLQALKTQLEGEISASASGDKAYTDSKVSECYGNSKSYTDGKIQGVNQSISSLDSRTQQQYQELFTSVSNGKREVAEAITDKGVSTSATDTFSQMATNIGRISGGGGTDTSDATATAGDILYGKTAYVKGQKIYGQNRDIVNESESGIHVNPYNPYPETDEVEVVYGSEPSSVDMKEVTGIPNSTFSISRDGLLLAYLDGTTIKFKKAFTIFNNISGTSHVAYNSSQIINNVTYDSPEYSVSELEIEGTVTAMAFCPMNSSLNRSSYDSILAILSNSNGTYYINAFGVSSKVDSTNHKICQLYTTNETPEGSTTTYYRKWKVNCGNRTNAHYNGVFGASPYSNTAYLGLGNTYRTSPNTTSYFRTYTFEDLIPSAVGSEYGYVTIKYYLYSKDWVHNVKGAEFYNNDQLIKIHYDPSMDRYRK